MRAVDTLDWARWAPWNRYKDAGDADGDVPEGVLEERLVDAPEVVPGTGGVVFINTRERALKEFFTQDKDLKDHGYARGCPGCNSIARGTTRQSHNPACRARFEALLRDSAKVRNAQKRKQEFEDKMKQTQARKLDKRSAASQGGRLGRHGR